MKYRSRFIFAVLPISCSNGCFCYYLPEKRVNLLNCSNAGISNLNNLTVPVETQWLTSDCSGVTQLCWSSNLENLEYIDLSGSNFLSICDDFFIRLKNISKVTYINLSKNRLSHFPKALSNVTSLDIYLAGNPVDCNCEMLWFVEWLNSTNNRTDTRPVKDYKEIRCSGEKWNGVQVYKLNQVVMGCVPPVLAKWVAFSLSS